MSLKLAPSAVLAISLVFTGNMLYQKFYVSAKNADPQGSHSIVYQKGDSRYDDLVYADGNFDGFITNKELQVATNFDTEGDVYAFIRKLNPQERKLLNGLTVKVAVMAYQALTPQEKKNLLKLDEVERINLINSRFEPLVS